MVNRMIHSCPLLLIVALVSSFAGAQTRDKQKNKPRAPVDSPGARQLLADLEHQWTEALKNRDRETLNRILDDGFVFTDEEGNVLNKAQYIDAVTQAIKIESYAVDDMIVRVYGGTGVVTGRWKGKLTIGGKDASGAFRYTDTFAMKLGRWRAVSAQDTRIPQRGSTNVGAEITTPSGLKYVDLVTGTGESPKPGQSV